MLVSLTSKPRINGFREAFVEPGFWEDLGGCPICQRSDFVRDVAVVEGDSQGTVTSVCMDCEYGFFRRRPTAGWFDRFYSRQWDQEGRSLAEHNLIAPRPDAKVLTFCEPYLQAGSNILEVGAGFGSLLLAFKEHGYNISAIERSEHRAAFVRDVLGLPCLCSPFESTDVPGRYALVYSNHVLEHVSDPLVVLRAIAACLSDGGMVYLAVPDLWQEYPPQAFHFVPHLSLFTLKSLTRLLASAGFRVIKSSTGREIQVLAVKAECTASDIAPSDEASRSRFWANVSNYICQAFGGHSGAYTLVWYRAAGSRTYRNRILSGTLLAPLIVRAIFRARHLFPNLVWMRIAAYRERIGLPGALVRGPFRMLTIQVAGDMNLPVKLRHGNGGPAVWVK